MAANERMNSELDDIDKGLLNAIQSDFPLVPHPFAGLATGLGISEIEAIERTKRLKENGIIRQISAIFDSRALGYQSTLAAMQVQAEKLDAVAARISEEPGVSHNYARNHPYNLWFTLTSPPTSDPEIELAGLAHKVGVEKWLYLPAVRLFKIGVRLNMLEEEERPSSHSPAQSQETDRPAAMVEVDPAVVRELQEDIELVSRPFAAPAARLGVCEDEMLATAKRLQEGGIMRRFAAVLHHRKAGFSANGMGAWVVPDERIEDVGTIMASFPQVTHCYQRPTYPDWPFNMFTMIHARSTDECEAVAREIAERAGIAEHRLLYSTKEYKKVRVKYFA